MVGTGTVFDLILDELEAGQADGIERLVVGTARIADRYGRGAEIMEGLQPLGEDVAAGFVALQIDATDLACTVVDIEIGGEGLVCGQ
jgi:hypothetical protein